MKSYLAKHVWFTLCIILVVILMFTTKFAIIMQPLESDDSNVSIESDVSLTEYMSMLKDELFSYAESSSSEGAFDNIVILAISLLLLFLPLTYLAGEILCAFFDVIIALLILIIPKKMKRTELPKLKPFSLFAPLFIWIGILVSLAFWNNIISSLLPRGSTNFTLSVEYTQGFNFLFIFIGAMVVYWVGYAIIHRFVKD